MTTFTDIQTKVYLLTNRPDLVSETNHAIQRATLAAHTQDNWVGDRMESTVSVTQDGNGRFSFDVSTLTRFGRLASIHENNSGMTHLIREFKRLEYDDLSDMYSNERTDYFYLAGTTVNLYASFPVSSIKVRWYQLPITATDGTYNSWIATRFPDVIIEKAAEFISMLTGNTEKAKMYKMMGNESMALLRQQCLESGTR